MRPSAFLLALASAAVVGLAFEALGQGSINFDNSQSVGKVSRDTPGNAYGGIYGLEVWELNSDDRRLLPEINGAAPFSAYGMLAADGFTPAATFANQNNSLTPGIIRLGEVDMPNVSPAGANVMVALAMWNTAAANWSAIPLSGDAYEVGVLAFVNPTADYTAHPTPTPPALSWWADDLVMVITTPEPSAAALAFLGSGMLFLMLRRRRK